CRTQSMMRGPIRSLQLRLVARVAALYIPAAIVVIAILMARAFDTARSLGDRELLARATELAKLVTIDPNGATRLELSPALTTIYQAPSVDDIFVIRDLDGSVIAASPPRFGEFAAEWSKPLDATGHFSIEQFGDRPQNYHGLTTTQDS